MCSTPICRYFNYGIIARPTTANVPSLTREQMEDLFSIDSRMLGEPVFYFSPLIIWLKLQVARPL